MMAFTRPVNINALSKENKRAWYGANGVKLREEGGGKAGALIGTRDTSEGGLDSGSFKKMIREVLNV